MSCRNIRATNGKYRRYEQASNSAAARELLLRIDLPQSGNVTWRTSQQRTDAAKGALHRSQNRI